MNSWLREVSCQNREFPPELLKLLKTHPGRVAIPELDDEEVVRRVFKDLTMTQIPTRFQKRLLALGDVVVPYGPVSAAPSWCG